MKIVDEISKLKKERNAIILAHNYQLPEVQDIADFVGDSLGLSIEAAKTQAHVIVFCGVHFMAETAKILSPGKTVLLPDETAGCPMAEMITEEDVRSLKAQFPRAKVVCYVNTSARVKAESDICCTSGNAEKIIREAVGEDETVIFIPDQYLARNIEQRVGRKFIFWEGYCPVHIQILPEDIEKMRSRYPGAEVLVHPECRPEVVALADRVLSTEGMCRYVLRSEKRAFIIGTEVGILHRMQKENPEKKFYPLSERAICPNMKKITLEKVLWALEENRHEIIVPVDVMERAKVSLEKMIQYQP
ncbi:MAG: quinolinate synthase NadA [Syntrophales bacterium]|nr:quinolinate synthase NadA [Syntrophales bacterium]